MFQLQSGNGLKNNSANRPLEEIWSELMTETGYKEILVNIQIIGTAVCIKTLVQLSAVCIGSVESVPVAKESRTQY